MKPSDSVDLNAWARLLDCPHKALGESDRAFKKRLLKNLQKPEAIDVPKKKPALEELK